MTVSDDNPSLLNVESSFYEGLKQKNKPAFERLFDKYSPSLYALITSIVPDAEAADEVLEKIFIRCWQRVGAFDPARHSIFTWLYSAARDEALVAKRQLELKRAVARKDSPSFKSVTALKELVMELSEPHRSVLILSCFENASDSEIALLIKTDAGSVRALRNAGLRFVNAILGGGENKKPSHLPERVPAF